MQSKNVMILGGYGSAGICIARLLLKETELRLILAGRNSGRADRAAGALNSEFPGNRVRGMQVDACSSVDLRTSFRACDTVIVCVPITALGIGGGIAQAAFEAGINYVDINLDTDKQQLLQRLAGRIQESRRYFLTEAGLMPGIPSTLARYAAARLNRLDSLQFGLLERETSGSYGSTIDLLNYAADPAYIYTQGAWRKTLGSVSKRIHFGPKFGSQSCYPMDLYELRPLPDTLGIKEIGFYAAGMNPITDAILLLWVILGLYKYGWSLRLGARLGLWSVKRFTKPPYGTALAMEARGSIRGRGEKMTVVVEHENGFVATAVAAVAGILQLLDGTIGEPGVTIMGHGVDPKRYLEDIRRLGMKVSIRPLPISSPKRLHAKAGARAFG